jgi:hypothetical protein
VLHCTCNCWSKVRIGHADGLPPGPGSGSGKKAALILADDGLNAPRILCWFYQSFVMAHIVFRLAASHYVASLSGILSLQLCSVIGAGIPWKRLENPHAQPHASCMT